jgi:hypothetical protein
VLAQLSQCHIFVLRCLIYRTHDAHAFQYVCSITCSCLVAAKSTSVLANPAVLGPAVLQDNCLLQPWRISCRATFRTISCFLLGLRVTLVLQTATRQWVALSFVNARSQDEMACCGTASSVTESVLTLVAPSGAQGHGLHHCDHRIHTNCCYRWTHQRQHQE